jgi:hypothetical protein
MEHPMRISPASGKVALLALTLSGGLLLASVGAGPALATPSRARDCTGCHGSGSVAGTVTARPSTTSPAPGAAYTVAITPPANQNGGQVGFWIATSTAAGATGASTGVTGGPSSAASFTARMTAPAAPGTYYYKVWSVHGPDDSRGVTNFAVYSVTVAAASPTASPAHVTRLSPARGHARATMTVVGRRFARRGTVRFGSAAARVISWRSTRIVVKVPAPRHGARRARVTVTPSGATASNAVMFTWLR